MQSSRVSWNKNLQTCTFNSFHSCLSCSIINFLGLPHKYMVYGFVGVILNHLISFHVVACDHAPQYGLFFTMPQATTSWHGIRNLDFRARKRFAIWTFEHEKMRVMLAVYITACGFTAESATTSYCQIFLARQARMLKQTNFIVLLLRHSYCTRSVLRYI